jgi:hypothetical protein
MTVRIGTMSVDGTPISEADLARIEAEEKLHGEQQRKAVRVVAGSALDADDCRTLLSILGLSAAAPRPDRSAAGPLRGRTAARPAEARILRLRIERGRSWA